MRKQLTIKEPGTYCIEAKAVILSKRPYRLKPRNLSISVNGVKLYSYYLTPNMNNNISFMTSLKKGDKITITRKRLTETVILFNLCPNT